MERRKTPGELASDEVEYTLRFASPWRVVDPEGAVELGPSLLAYNIWLMNGRPALRSDTATLLAVRLQAEGHQPQAEVVLHAHRRQRE